MFASSRRNAARAALGLAAAGAAMMTGARPAAAQNVDDIIKKGKLVVAIDTSTAPYAALGATMEPEGFDIDLARMMAKSLGVPVEFVTVNSPGRIPALLTNRVDVVVSIFSITPERAQQVAFSIPYGGQSSVLLAPKSLAVKSVGDLVGKKVALTRGAMEDIVLTAEAKKFPGITLLRFDDGPSVTQAMLSGQVDAMGGGDFGDFGDIYLKKSATGEQFELNFPLHAFHYGIGMRRGNPDLLHWVNTFIYYIKNDNSLEALSQKWRKAPLPSLPVF